ncbi:type VI secretion system tip protein VgrG [Pseudomonas sp. MPC6]|uniref:type VI secretion system Vgr family protein n=1 Tax=Pseudomonas sp. MPC6 TaxID=2498848 RepID=UPI00110FFA44|nr:type VI secretion system tip protein VgrG [Pseudomonas sp. MPC6]QCY12021.1 type VI secretion system tip protein VgrG [Pseudomonas sp. MPC6]
MSSQLPIFFDHSRHKLHVLNADLTLDVLAFHGEEQLSQPFHYVVEFTCTKQDLAADQLLNREAQFSLHPVPKKLTFLTKDLKVKPLRTFNGVITAFKRLSGSVDEARYEITLEPRLALLARGQQFRLYQHQSVPEIVEQILRSRHDFRGQDFFFKLTRTYPKRLQVMQYGESDPAFIARLLAEVGIWYRFTSDERLKIDAVEFHDDQLHYQSGIELPYHSPAGLSSSEQDGVWSLQTHHQVVERQVNIRTYQHRDARAHLDGEIDHTRGATTTYGEAYHYAEPYSALGDRYQFYEDLPPETGYFYARLQHERYLNDQTRLSGTSSSATLAPGQVLKITGGAPQAFARGTVITHLSTRAARDASFEAQFEAIPYSESVCFRPPLLAKPQIAGTVPARVSNPQKHDPYAEIDVEGRYRVQFLFDRDTWNPGQESMWLRLARPYAGDTHGLHLPLIAGTEVAVAFEQGDPDRPYIAHALHDSEHPDHVTLRARNYKRNVLRTPANNKLRMEDTRGEEHVKLSTEHSGKSQLNLGHLVDAEQKKRGAGFELRTDGWGAIRAGKGLFISTDEQAKAHGQQLDMTAAIEQLESALSLARSLANAAYSGQATPGDIDSQTRLNQALKGLAQPGLLLQAPAGIGLVSPEALCLSSGSASVGIMAAHNTDISAGHDVTAAAESGISLFAKRADLKLKAAKGKVELHAQGSDLHALAKTDIKIESVEGRVEISAPDELLFRCGGAYIRLKGGEIELGAPGNIYLKAAHVQKLGGASLDTPATPLPAGYAAGYTVKDDAQAPVSFNRYRITTQQGEVFNGVTDKDGQTMSVHTLVPGDLKIEFPDSEQWISFSAPQDLNYQGIKCTATMDDGSVLQGEFDSENRANFYSFAGKSCVKFEVENLDNLDSQQSVLSGAQKLLKELAE